MGVDSAMIRRATKRETGVVLAIVTALLGALRALGRSRRSLVIENLVLRQQLAVLRRKVARPRLRPLDRAFWIALSRVWSR